MFYEPKKGSPFKIDPFKSLVFPRPIGWISSISKNGIANLAPYSYFNAVADEPPQVMFCSNGSSAHGKYKDSLSNILTTKEFVVNFATSNSRNQMNISSRDLKPDKDEFILSNLKKKKSRLVKAPSVKDSPVNLECKLVKTIKYVHNSGYFFSSGDDTWHGLELKEIQKERRCIQINYVTFSTDWQVEKSA